MNLKLEDSPDMPQCRMLEEPQAQTRSGKRPVYNSCKVLRTVASPVVQKCRMLQESQAQTEASSLREEVGTQLLACSATQVLEM